MMYISKSGFHCLSIAGIHRRINIKTKCVNDDHQYQQKEIGNKYSVRCINCGKFPEENNTEYLKTVLESI